MPSLRHVGPSRIALTRTHSFLLFGRCFHLENSHQTAHDSHTFDSRRHTLSERRKRAFPGMCRLWHIGACRSTICHASSAMWLARGESLLLAGIQSVKKDTHFGLGGREEVGYEERRLFEPLTSLLYTLYSRYRVQISTNFLFILITIQLEAQASSSNE